MADARHGLFQHLSQPPSSGTIPFEEIEGHPLRRLGTHAGQAAQGLHELIQQRFFGHRG